MNKITSLARAAMFVLLALFTSASAWALTPLEGDTWNESTKTLTVNSNLVESAYYGETEIEHLIISSGVTTISDYAFYGSGLTSITIPASVTSIGSGAFSNCSKLATITVDGGNTNFKMIGGVLFSMDETHLVVYPAGKNDIDSYAIPNSVTSIGDEAFNGCTALTSITNLDNVTSIGDYAFQNCTGLTSFTIPDGIATLSEGLFYECKNMTSINIPNSVTSIGESAFEDCTGLTSVIIGSGVTTIGEDAFYNCTGLTSVIIPNTVTSIGYDAFYNTPWLNNLSYDDDGISYIGTMAVASKDASGSIIIKPGTTAIASALFDGNDDITSVFIPASVKSIGDYAFYDCDYLQTITFEENSQLTSIGKYAFYFTGLNTITIPAGVTAIGEGAFKYCYYLNKVTFENGSQLTAIGDDTFYYCYKMQDITIPAGVTSIGDYAFYYCYLMKDITIPAGVTAIGEGAFYDCYYLNKVTFEKGSQLKTIGDEAFEDCYLMKDITIPASVTSIGADAFYNCTSMMDVYCLADPTKLTWDEDGHDDFNYDKSNPYIQTVCHVENAADWAAFVDEINVRFAGGYCGNTAANGGKNLHWDVVMNGSDYILKISKNPNAVGTDFSMADNVDFGGKDFNSITIENGVTNIGASAFAGFTNLTSVTIPSSVTSIGASAFSGSTSLKSLLVQNETPSSLGSNAFKDIDNNAVFTVLNSAYLTSDGWKDVKNHTGDYDGCAFTMTVPDASYYNIAYIDENGQPAVCPLAFPITSSSDDVDLDYSGDTWYFVTGDVVIDKDLTFKNSVGTTNLILCDGASLTTCKLTANNSMNIYVQTNGTGALTINNAVDKANAFYVENDLVINGGNITVNATGDNGYGIFSKKGDITINKGTITSDVTFINIYANSYGRDLVINGGTINASTKEYGLYASGDLIVNGGMVNVKMTSSDYEGLGAYYNLNINGGQVTVDSDGKGYGLYANNNDLTINGGTITVKNTKYGIDTYYGTIKINDGVITITDAEYGLYAYSYNIEINGGKITANGSSIGMFANRNISLGWKEADDLITTSSFSLYGTMSVPSKNFTDGTSIYNSTTPSATLGALTDVTLSPLAVLEDAADNTTALTSLDGKKIAVALNGRTLKAGHWNSVFLPFALDDAQIAASFGADAIVKTLDSYSNDGTNVTIGFTTVTTMEAGKPYIVFIPEDENIVNPIFMGATINPVSSSVTKGDAQFCGVYAPMNLGKSLYRLFLQNDKFYYPNETGATINAFRGYFALTNPVPEAASAKIIVDFGDEETTGIGAALNENGEMTNDVWYTLQGVKLDGKPVEKGIYIVNGKKVAIQ